MMSSAVLNSEHQTQTFWIFLLCTWTVRSQRQFFRIIAIKAKSYSLCRFKSAVTSADERERKRLWDSHAISSSVCPLLSLFFDTSLSAWAITEPLPLSPLLLHFKIATSWSLGSARWGEQIGGIITYNNQCQGPVTLQLATPRPRWHLTRAHTARRQERRRGRENGDKKRDESSGGKEEDKDIYEETLKLVFLLLSAFIEHVWLIESLFVCYSKNQAKNPNALPVLWPRQEVAKYIYSVTALKYNSEVLTLKIFHFGLYMLIKFQREILSFSLHIYFLASITIYFADYFSYETQDASKTWYMVLLQIT